ncbi:MAG: GIY-YIG nuclease family protein [bacterium]
MKNKKGIYKIINLENGKFYLGSTKNLKKRKREHFWALRKNRHNNPYLQNSFNKHGKEKFKFKIVKIVKNESDLLDVEQKYLDKTKSYDRKIGYNINEIASGGGLYGENNPNYGKPMSKEQKKKISETLMGHKVSKETRKKMSQNRKGKFAGKNNPNYGKTLSEKRKKKQSEVMKGRYKGAKNPSARAVVQLDKNENFIAYHKTMTQAAKGNGAYKSGICLCCKRKQNTCGGFKWQYAENYKKECDIA